MVPFGSETTSNIAYLSQVRKRDLWRRPIRTSLHHRAFLSQTCPNLPPPDFLLCSVRASAFRAFQDELMIEAYLVS